LNIEVNFVSSNISYEIFIVPTRILRSMILKVRGLPVEKKLLFSDFKENVIFWTDFRKRVKCKIS